MNSLRLSQVGQWNARWTVSTFPSSPHTPLGELSSCFLLSDRPSSLSRCPCLPPPPPPSLSGPSSSLFPLLNYRVKFSQFHIVLQSAWFFLFLTISYLSHLSLHESRQTPPSLVPGQPVSTAWLLRYQTRRSSTTSSWNSLTSSTLSNPASLCDSFVKNAITFLF